MVPFLSLTKLYLKVITQLKFSSLWVITVFWICSEHMLRKDSPSFFFSFLVCLAVICPNCSKTCGFKSDELQNQDFLLVSHIIILDSRVLLCFAKTDSEISLKKLTVHVRKKMKW